MVRIGVIANEEKDSGLTYTRVLAESIIKQGGQARLQPGAYSKIGLGLRCENDEEVFTGSDILICLGGDGTFLQVARLAYREDLPILGINLGSMGFLTEVEKNDIDHAVEHIISGNYDVEERMMLDAAILRDGNVISQDIALNDVVISRGALSRILHVKTYINHIFVDTFPGDGLIVSSPTGSTAYTLSAGGPIVEPDLDLVIVTPICPHILYTRSFITTGDRLVKAVVEESYSHTAMVTVDGQEGYEVRGGDVIEVKKSTHRVKLVRINSRNFFNVLRKKIYYRGESLRGYEV